MWQTDSTVYKLKPRLFHKFTQLQVHLVDFHSQCEPCLTLIQLTQKNILWRFNSFCYNILNSLKKIFTSTSIFTYQIPDAVLIMETNALDYTLAVFLFIVNKNKVYLVVFHSYTFTAVELNYNIYDKELLAIFEAFKIWQYYWPILSTLLWIIKALSIFLLPRC